MVSREGSANQEVTIVHFLQPKGAKYKELIARVFRTFEAALLVYSDLLEERWVNVNGDCTRFETKDAFEFLRN